MPDRLHLTRDQIARIVGNNDPKAIKQLEKLFAVAEAVTPIVESDVSTEAGTADAKAMQALSEVSSLQQLVMRTLLRPEFTMPNNVKMDYIDFDRDPNYVQQVRRVAWNPADDTLNIHHSNGVTLQVGLEEYARFTNTTGATLTNGSAVGLQYSGGVTLANVVNYLADGNTPVLNILGVLTEDVVNGGQGRITVRGNVRDINTSGWAVGDVLYPSPSVAGQLTNVKPTAPQACIPIAIVLFSHATLGVIAVRPTVEQQESYGSFSDSTDQTAGAIYTPQAVTFDTTNFSQGFSIVSSSRVTASNSGLYNFQLIAQVTNSGGSTKLIWFWVRKNGTDVANTVVSISVQGSSSVVVPAWNYFLSMAKNDYLQLMWAVDDTAVTLNATAAQAGGTGVANFTRPATPSASITVSIVAQ